jgi:hypothetical protein
VINDPLLRGETLTELSLVHASQMSLFFVISKFGSARLRLRMAFVPKQKRGFHAAPPLFLFMKPRARARCPIRTAILPMRYRGLQPYSVFLFTQPRAEGLSLALSDPELQGVRRVLKKEANRLHALFVYHTKGDAFFRHTRSAQDEGL